MIICPWQTNNGSISYWEKNYNRKQIQWRIQGYFTYLLSYSKPSPSLVALNNYIIFHDSDHSRWSVRVSHMAVLNYKQAEPTGSGQYFHWPFWPLWGKKREVIIQGRLSGTKFILFPEHWIASFQIFACGGGEYSSFYCCRINYPRKTI